MKRLAWRTLAKLWQQWRLRQLHAQIEIYRQLLYEARTELADLRELEGEALLLRFGSYTREELAPFFRQQKAWEGFVEDLFIVSLAESVSDYPSHRRGEQSDQHIYLPIRKGPDGIQAHSPKHYAQEEQLDQIANAAIS